MLSVTFHLEIHNFIVHELSNVMHILQDEQVNEVDFVADICPVAEEIFSDIYVRFGHKNCWIFEKENLSGPREMSVIEFEWWRHKSTRPIEVNDKEFLNCFDIFLSTFCCM